LSKTIGTLNQSAAYRQALLSHGLANEVATHREFAHAAEARRREIELCATAQARPACAVTVRYLYRNRSGGDGCS
jgi:adenosine deaminase